MLTRLLADSKAYSAVIGKRAMRTCSRLHRLVFHRYYCQTRLEPDTPKSGHLQRTTESRPHQQVEKPALPDLSKYSANPRRKSGDYVGLRHAHSKTLARCRERGSDPDRHGVRRWSQRNRRFPLLLSAVTWRLDRSRRGAPRSAPWSRRGNGRAFPAAAFPSLPRRLTRRAPLDSCRCGRA